MPIKLEVWGDYACFTRPELKVERYSYDVMTPSAARGILEAIYWHPCMKWRIDKIYVLNPIKFVSIKRNEVSEIISGNSVRTKIKNGKLDEAYLCTKDCIQQRTTMALRDVHYIIEAHFEMSEKATADDNEGKVSDIVRRRMEKGQCFNQPYFGVREFPVSFKKWEGKEITTAYQNISKDLGLMLYDMNYDDHENTIPMFFRAELINGILEIPDIDSEEILK